MKWKLVKNTLSPGKNSSLLFQTSSNANFEDKRYLCLSGIQTRVVGVLSKYADHLPTPSRPFGLMLNTYPLLTRHHLI